MSEAPRAVEIAPDGMLVVDHPAALPATLDVLVVGGGPFGTAAAFRARELGLSVLVIDYDDLMKRIRDYAKDKLILPDYGGGDRMQFPSGGDLISALQFPPIDKDELCARWKALYRRFSVPAQIGVEMTGLERDGDAWRLKAWNHTTKAEQTIRARHVVLAFGRGVPRRLDIPGDVTGLAFALTSASQYTGGPACVLGGGTSAAEAVIAISNAKATAGDRSAVYWSYRGDKMPKVSKALADVFFEAFMGHGNVRYLPNSEPVAIIDLADEAFLAIRTARVSMDAHPSETTHLEFRKQLCIACIGEDIPEALLTAIGVPLVSGGATNKKRIVVSPLLETQQPNVYLAGDVLSPAYYETTEFDADPSTFAEIKRRGNIKAALRDGVLIAEAIAQKLSGRGVINVQLRFAPGGHAPVAAEPRRARDAPAVAATGAAPASATIATVLGKGPLFGGVGEAAAPIPACTLVSILPGGVEANEYPLRPAGTTTIGRRGADVTFPEDAALSDIHAAIVGEGDRYQVRDEGSAQGVFLQPGGGRALQLHRGAILRVGTQWLVVGDRHSEASLLHHDATGKRIARHQLPQRTVIVGRESPDITIAPHDAALSRRHVALTVRDGTVTVKDLGSANGTLLKVTTPIELVDGDRLLIGQQVLQFNDERASSHPAIAVTVDTVSRRPAAMAAAPPQPPAAAHAKAAAAVTPATPANAPAAPRRTPAAPAAGAAADSSPAVLFDALRHRVPCAKGQTICEVAEAAHIKIDADCHQGVCGMDPVLVKAGGEHLNPVGGTERSTLEDLCSLTPGTYRLACMARVSGPVTVDIVKQ